MKTVAIIQARMGSTRLPGKVMMELDGHPVIEWCVRACYAATGVDLACIATSTLPADDVIADWCERNSVVCHRGSETDVLSRFMGAADATAAEVILRITGDCPFVDPQVIGEIIRLQQVTGAHYVSNVSPRTYPDGLDVEAFTLVALVAAHTHATRPIDRDCVTTWIARNRSLLRAEALINPLPGMQEERWVLDTEADLKFCRTLADRLAWHAGPPSMLRIVHALDTAPGVREINATGIMNERYFEALAEEPIYERTYERSQAQFARALNTIPLAAQTFSKSHLQYPQPSPLFLSHGDGGLTWDIDGNEYVDLVSALLPNVLGHRDPDVDLAIRRQAASGISFSLATELEAELAETLCRLIPCAEAVRFGKTGTDVTTAAIRAARAFTGRDRVLICGGYHGWADWSVERNLGVPEDVRKLTDRIPFGEKALPIIYHGDYAAVIVEPESDPDFLRRLRDVCDGRRTLLIFDEVITGFRFDLGGAQKLFGVTPDLATFAKAMANGMPLSAVVGRKDIMAKFAPPDNIFYSGTMFGETLSLAASLATIRKLERDQVIPRLWSTGSDLAFKVQRLVTAVYQLDEVIKISGSAPFVRLKFRDDKIAALFRKRMIESGTLIVASHNICAAHGPNEVRRVLKSYEHALKYIEEAVVTGNIDEQLAGASVAAGVRTS